MISNRLKWNEEDFGGLSVVRIDSRQIWKPDIEIYNSAVKNLYFTSIINLIYFRTSITILFQMNIQEIQMLLSIPMERSCSYPQQTWRWIIYGMEWYSLMCFPGHMLQLFLLSLATCKFGCNKTGVSVNLYWVCSG